VPTSVASAAIEPDSHTAPVAFPENILWEAEQVIADPAKVAKLRRSLLNGGLIIVAGTMFAFLYRRWSWRREVRRMDEKFAEKPVDTSNTLAYYRSNLNSEELLEDDLKEALRTNRAAHDVRVQLLQFYASKREVQKFTDCAKDMYRLTRGRIPEWQDVIEMGLALDPDMNFYDVDEPSANDLITRNEAPVPMAQTKAGAHSQRSDANRFEEIDDLGTIAVAPDELEDKAMAAMVASVKNDDLEPMSSPALEDHADVEMPAAINVDEDIDETTVVGFSSNPDDEEIDPTTVIGIDPNTEVDVQLSEVSLADFLEKQFASDDELTIEKDQPSVRDFTRTIDLVEEYAKSDDDITLTLYDENEDVSVKDERDDLAYDVPPDDPFAGLLDESFPDVEEPEFDASSRNLTQTVDEGVQRDMELKLVLARAYIENRFLGEAAALLDEVIQKGTTKQQIQAELLKRDIDGDVRKRA